MVIVSSARHAWKHAPISCEDERKSGKSEKQWLPQVCRFGFHKTPESGVNLGFTALAPYSWSLPCAITHGCIGIHIVQFRNYAGLDSQLNKLMSSRGLFDSGIQYQIVSKSTHTYIYIMYVHIYIYIYIYIFNVYIYICIYIYVYMVSCSVFLTLLPMVWVSR